ncbi:hypothetical protein LZ30DRAFT_786203 [Colletotrichum cereale]|nr:hypothetical protein LZ30DRAFT_786203 [Colletotrichum cereale]
MRGVGNNKHSTNEYVITTLLFRGSDTRSEEPQFAKIQREVSVVDNLPANMLLGMDCMGPEKFDILNSKGCAVIHTCNTKIPMSSWHDGHRYHSCAGHINSARGLR